MLSKQEVIVKLSDEELVAKLQALGIKENETTIEVLQHLAEVDRRKLYLPAGYSSLFSYCTQGALRYSEPAAQRRISCARAIAQIPELLPLLLNKELSLSTLSLASNVLSAENKTEVLALIRGKTRRETEELLSRYHPRPKPREVIKPLAAVSQLKRQETPAIASLFEAPAKSVASPEKPQENLFTSAREGRTEDRNTEHKEEVKPLAVEQRYEIRFSINSELKQKLDKARVLLSGKYPRGAGLEDVLGEALELLLEKKSPEQRSKRREERRAKKLGREQTKQSSPAKPSRHIPQELRDQVHQRDGGCCAFVGSDGRRCAERFNLTLHHVKPFANITYCPVSTFRNSCSLPVSSAW